MRLRLRAGKKARRGDGEARSGAGDAETPRGADDVEPALFGRDADIEALLESEAPVTVLAGDSGVGKSAVLRALPGRSRGVLAARPYLLLHSESFEHGVLCALADPLATLAGERGMAREIASRLAGAAQGIADRAHQDLPKIALATLMEAGLGPLGKPLADLIGDPSELLSRGGARGLAARVGKAADPLVVETLCAFLEEAASFADGRTVLLPIDGGERLDDPDLDVVADLAARLPAKLRIAIAFATATPRQDRMVRDLGSRAAEVEVMELPPLGVEAVSEWLAEAGVDARVAPRILASAEGNALVLGDLVEVLRRGGQLEDVPPTEQLGRLTDIAWDELSPQARGFARRLCVLDQPLPDEYQLKLLDTDSSTWADALRELRRSRILITRADGRSGYHELRRRYVLDHILEPFERQELCTRAIEVVLEVIDASEDYVWERWAPEVALLMDQGGRIPDPLGEQLVQAEPDELVLLGGALEILGHELQEDVLGDYVAQHWRPIESPERAFRKLAERGLLTRNEHKSTVLPAEGEAYEKVFASYEMTEWSESVLTAVAGLCSVRLGRFPLPMIHLIAADLWLRPDFPPFWNAGIGWASPESIAARADRAVWGAADQGGPREFDRYYGLAYTGLLRDVPVFAIGWWLDPAQRDASAARIQRTLETPAGTLVTREVMPLPLHRAPSLLWAYAGLDAFDLELDDGVFEQAEEYDFRPPLMRWRLPVPKLDDPLSLVDAMNRRLEVDAVLLEHADPEERWAAHLWRNQTVHVSLHEDNAVEVVSSGGEPGLCVHDEPLPSRDVDTATLRRILGLGAAEWIDRVDDQPRAEDHPLLGRLQQHRETMKAFDVAMWEHGAAVLPFRVELDPRGDGVASALERARVRQMELIAAFAERFADLGASPSTGVDLLLVLALEPPGHTIVGWRSSAAAFELERSDGSAPVRVEVVEGVPMEAEAEGFLADEGPDGYRDINSTFKTTFTELPPNALQSAFGLTAEEAEKGIQTSLPALVSLLLGFDDPQGIEFAWAE